MKQLAGQTAIYGLSSILGRTINFTLVPLQTAVLSQAEYGINIDFYSLIAFLIVVVTFGMETAYFRFAEKEHFDEPHTFGAIVSMIAAVLLAFGLSAYLFEGSLLRLLKWESQPQYLYYLLAILAIDALAALPFARLRRQNKAVKFASIKLTLIVVNVLFNLYVFLPSWWEMQGTAPWWNHELRGVVYIFQANLWASGVMLLLLLPTFRPLKFTLQRSYTLPLLRFGLPLLVGGLAGIANEMLDRQLLKYLLPQEWYNEGVGSYGAVYKISIFLVLFNQAFRYAAEPFFFKNAKAADGRERMAKVMTGFAWFMSVGMVLVIAFLDVLKHFIASKYWPDLYLVPILLLANVILGINTNLNVWYKVSDRTRFGVYITFSGLLVTVVGNVLLIPRIGLLGAAVTTLLAYATMFASSYWWSLKHYPVPYEWRKIGLFVGSAALVSAVSFYFPNLPVFGQMTLGVLYLLVMAATERNGLFNFARQNGR